MQLFTTILKIYLFYFAYSYIHLEDNNSVITFQIKIHDLIK